MYNVSSDFTWHCRLTYKIPFYASSPHRNTVSIPDLHITFQKPPTNQHNNMPPFYSSVPSAIAPTPAYTATYLHSTVPLMMQYSTLSTIVSPTPYASMASSFTISEILHEISKADIPAQPTSTLDLMVKTASYGSGSGGLSTGATLGIISGIVFVVIILAFIVVKCLRH
jgi:hypothetical protein